MYFFNLVYFVMFISLVFHALTQEYSTPTTPARIMLRGNRAVPERNPGSFAGCFLVSNIFCSGISLII